MSTNAEVFPQPKKKTSAERPRSYRKRLQTRPDKLHEIMEKDRKRHEKARPQERRIVANSIIALEEKRRKKRETMRKYRAKKKNRN